MKKIINYLAILFSVTACSSVKTVGDGMTVGSAGVGAYGAPIAAVGAVLSIGADLFSSVESLTQDEMVAKESSKWGKPHTTTETTHAIRP